MYTYVDYSTRKRLRPSNSEAVTECIDLGYISTSDYVRIVQKADNSTNQNGDFAEISFSIQKAQSTSQTNAGIRYSGINPNNYIWFNNELWRIIGVFDSNTHGQTGQNLVKIIRNDTLGGLAWDKDHDDRDWSQSTLKELLNTSYYNSLDGTNSGNCYSWSSTVLANCDYTDIGINDNSRPMVKNVTWYLGGYLGTYFGFSISPEQSFIYERSGEYNGADMSKQTTGYIGLMYASDYGYAAYDDSCKKTIGLSSYGDSPCSESNWLYKNGYEWTISAYAETSSYRVATINPSGSLANGILNYASPTRPVLYLDSSVYVLDGDGSIINPYIIGM